MKLPFDPTRAKGTAYQTGIWVPLVVAGPLVSQPGRDVVHMTNIADIYQLFGEIAGIDVPNRVVRPLDSVPMLPYLTNPEQPSIRSFNFTQIGLNLQLDGGLNGPCNFGTSCSHSLREGVCRQWLGLVGPGPTDPATRFPPQSTIAATSTCWLTKSAPGRDPPRPRSDPHEHTSWCQHTKDSIRTRRLCGHTPLILRDPRDSPTEIDLAGDISRWPALQPPEENVLPC